jgi:hypothetical protein
MQMIEHLQSEFDRLAQQAHPTESMLVRIEDGIDRRRRVRRRLTIGSAAATVAAVVCAIVLLGPDGPGNRPRPVAAADATPTPATRELPATSGTAPTVCVAPDYVPDPAPLATTAANGRQNLALTVLPLGWSIADSDPGFTMYAAPQDPRRTRSFAGRIVVLTGSSDDQPADFQPTTTIAGHPAEISMTDPCSTPAAPGQWSVTLQLRADEMISVQGPLSLRLDDQQMREIAASALVRHYVAGHG